VGLSPEPAVDVAAAVTPIEVVQDRARRGVVLRLGLESPVGQVDAGVVRYRRPHLHDDHVALLQVIHRREARLGVML